MVLTVARELTYRSKSNFPNANETWKVIGLYKQNINKEKFDTRDFNWIKKNFVSEMSKFQEKKEKKLKHLKLSFLQMPS